MANASQMRRANDQSELEASITTPFAPGTIVVVTLGDPREKFWGMILALRVEGLSLTGVELASFEDLTLMVKDGEPFSPAVVFFPMHRIERIEVDLPDGNLPSLSQRFSAKTGMSPEEIFRSRAGGHITVAGVANAGISSRKDSE